MATKSKINVDVLNTLIIGRIEPQIYAFSTGTVPNYLKVGDTYRPLEVRLNEWRKHFPKLVKKFGDVAKVDDDTFFRDYAVHFYLESELKRTRLEKSTFNNIPHYSNEFFKNATVKDIQDAIKDIKNGHKDNNPKYQYYRFDESHVPITHTYRRTETYKPRPNQKETIENFKKALKKGRKNLLMYAVMRFGKSFTSMCCAVEMCAELVIVVSAKADVKEEWKRTTESHVRFIEYCFLDSNSLLQSENIITEKQKNKEKIVLFLTLQDLQGDNIKRKHKEIFQSQVDLLLIDETHFGARAAEYGKVLRVENLTDKEIKSELKFNDIDLDDIEINTKEFNAKVRIHLSGTPYRILMNSEFTRDDIIAFYQFSNIAEDQKKWDLENINKDDIKEWDNPYYGFPQMIRFAFNPNESSRKKMQEMKKYGVTYAFSELFRPESITIDNVGKLHKKFKYEKEILDLLKVVDGTEEDDNLLSFLDYEKIKEGQMCRHIVCVLPYRASCDSLETLIRKNRFKHLSKYEIINISGVESEKTYKDTETVKATIKKCESENKKTITLTVNRMLTGSTVHEWDTMLYLKDTASPQEYDQAIFRLQNQYIKVLKETNGDVVKFNMKPQTLLVDFNPTRVFQMQEHKSQIYNVNTEKNGNSKLEERISKELEISPIVVINKNKIVQIEPSDILDAVREYSSSRSVFDEATSIAIDFSLLDIEAIKTEIEKQAVIGSRQGLEIKGAKGDGDDIEIGGTSEGGTDGSGDEGIPGPTETSGESEVDYKGKFGMYYARILFFSFLTDTKIKSLRELIGSIKQNKDNLRILSNLNLNIEILSIFEKYINPFVLSELDYKIQNINTLANDKSIHPIERASNAMNKFGRLSDSEVVTPSFLVESIISDLKVSAIDNSTFLLDIASKQGEFVYAVYKIFGKKVAANFYSIPTSKIAYEFTRKVYKLLDLSADNIEASYSTYDMIKENRLIQKNNIKINKRKMKFNVIVGNPPYQQNDGGHGRSASPIYHKFVEQAKKLQPRYLSMIIPARWFAGGKGLDEFRTEMLNDRHIRKLVDFENSNDVFPGVDVAGGICYFLWDKENAGTCEVTNYINGKAKMSERVLNEFPIFIRHSQALPIIRKVIAKKENGGKNLSEVVSSSKPFGIRGHHKPSKSGIPCYFTQRQGLLYVKKEELNDNFNLLDKYKLLIPRAPIAGQTDFSKPVGFYYDGNTRIAKPGEACTESWIVAFAGNTRKEVISFKSYLFTKIFRFLLLQTVVSQDVTRGNFKFIPDLGKYEGVYTDEILCKRWGITKEEWAFIDSKIKSVDK